MQVAVYRFARAASLDELLVKTTTRETQIDGFEPYLQRRWNEGCMNANRLYDEIRAQGFSGGVQIVRRYLRQFRADPAASARPTPLKARQVTTWIMQEPTSLEADEQESLQRVLDRCPELHALAGHVRAFAERPTGWSFGCCPRARMAWGRPRWRRRWGLKMLKRQMFGRAKFDLLRRRLRAPTARRARL